VSGPGPAPFWEFTAPLWIYGGAATWYFLTLPFEVTDEIDEITTGQQGGFGSVPVKVTVGRTTWTTSVFPSKERESFILPVKAAVRKAEGLADGTPAQVRLELAAWE